MGLKIAGFASLAVALSLVGAALHVAAVAAPAPVAAGASCDQALPFVDGHVSNELDQASGALWYRYDAKQTTAVGFAVRTPVSDFVPVVAVFGSCGAGAEIAQIEGNAGELQTRVEVDVMAGNSYFIRISKKEASAGKGFAFGGGLSPVGGCADPLSGDCFENNGSAFCDDTCDAGPPSGNCVPGPVCAGCCNTVCAIDSFCCEVSWDGICAGEACDNCVVVPVDLMEFDTSKAS